MNCLNLKKTFSKKLSRFDGRRTMFGVSLISDKMAQPEVEKIDEFNSTLSILDLPELVLESILERLAPNELCNVSCTCRALRDRCRSDYLWVQHMHKKWASIVGQRARREWLLFTDLRSNPSSIDPDNSTGGFNLVPCMWNLSWIVTAMIDGKKARLGSPFSSNMNWFLLLESGKFWVSAQVYSHQRITLCCNDAILSYDRFTNTFRARYPSYEQNPLYLEQGIEWDRVRAPPTDNLPHKPHVSDCGDDLHPGDHVEIQWRMSIGLPFGWWYAVVGHLQSCDGNQNHCLCSCGENVMIEFRQYSLQSRWRNVVLPRKDSSRIEIGNGVDGFYGGIRKLYSEMEINVWKKLWPNEQLL